MVEIIDQLELFPASELRVMICRLPSGEEVIKFDDCMNSAPIIYKWCFEMAVEWIKQKGVNPNG